MNFYLIIFIIVTSVFFALMEIQIEGENGWASKLPTWRVKNPFHRLFNWPYLTGYHIFLDLFLLAVLQLPFFLNFEFNWKNEMLILEILLSILILEDFFWFVFNPKWGIKKFFTQEIPWCSKKILFLPKNYWVEITMLIMMEWIRRRL